MSRPPVPWLAVRGLAVVAALLGAGVVARAEDPPKAEAPKLDPKVRLEMIKGGRGYLHP